jgi:hypothetical protein
MSLRGPVVASPPRLAELEVDAAVIDILADSPLKFSLL